MLACALACRRTRSTCSLLAPLGHEPRWCHVSDNGALTPATSSFSKTSSNSILSLITENSISQMPKKST